MLTFLASLRPKNPSHGFAALLVCGATFIFSSQLIMQKLATANGIPMIALVATGFFLSGLLLIPIACKPATLRVSPKVWFGLALLSCARLGALSSYFMALEQLPASNAVLLFYLGPLFILIQYAISGAERIRPLHILIFMLAFTGIMIALQVSRAGNLTGIAWALVAAVFLSWDYMLSRAYIPAGRSLANYSLGSVILSAIVLLLAGVAKIAAPQHLPELTPAYFIISFALVPLMVLPKFMLVLGIQIIGASRASLYALSEPVFVIFIACVLGWEVLSMHMVIGAATVITALILLNLTSRKKN